MMAGPMNLDGNRETRRRFKCPLDLRRHEHLTMGDDGSGSLWKNSEPLPLINYS
jgi:hypothetical protein